MADTSRALDDIRKLGRTFKGLIDLSEELERVGSLEKLANESQARIDRMKSEQAGLVTAADKARNEASTHAKNALEAKQTSQDLVNNAKGEAQAAADRIKAVAVQEASQIIEKAKAESEKITADITKAKDSLLSLSSEIRTKEARVSELDAKLAEIRHRIG